PEPADEQGAAGQPQSSKRQARDLMTTPRLASTQADPPRGCRRAWGGPALRLPTFPSSRKDDDPSSCEYASRSPEGMVAGLGAARRSGSSVPLLAQGWRPLVLRVRKPIPRGDGRRAWGGPALRLQRSPPRARMATPRLASTQADPPRGWSPGLGRPGAPAPAFPSSRKDGDPSSCEYASRSPEGMVAGLGAARRSGSSVPLLAQGWRPLVLRVRKPIPRGDVAGLGAARRSGSNVPLFAQGWRPLVLRVRKPILRGDVVGLGAARRSGSSSRTPV